MDLVAKFFIRRLEDPGHHFIIEIHDQVPNKNNTVPYLANPSSRYLACASDHIIDGSVLSRDTYPPIDIDNGLEKFPIKGFSPQRNNGVVSAEDQMKKELITIQVNGSPAQISPEDRDMPRFAKAQVYLLFQVLMETDTDIGRGRGNQRKGLPS